jgi:hypothetical protein
LQRMQRLQRLQRMQRLQRLRRLSSSSSKFQPPRGFAPRGGCSFRGPISDRSNAGTSRAKPTAPARVLI